MQVIARMPALKSLDGAPVTAAERRAAPAALQHEAVILDLMLSNICLLHKLVGCLPATGNVLKRLRGSAECKLRLIGKQ